VLAGSARLEPAEEGDERSARGGAVARVLALQRSAGNRAVAELARETAPHPMAKEIEVAEALSEEGWLDTTQQSLRVELTKTDNSKRTTQLGYLRAVEAFALSPRYKAKLQKPTVVLSAVEQAKLIERKWTEGQIASAGSVRLGFERAAKSKSPHAAEQARLLQQDIKVVQEEFKDKVKHNAYKLLDESERRIKHVLRGYGLVTARADEAIEKVFMYEGEVDAEVEKWMEAARKGQRGFYESPDAVAKRGDLDRQIQQLRLLQAEVVKRQAAFLKRFGSVPLDEADRRAEDRKAKKLGTAAPLLVETLSPDARRNEAEIQRASRVLAAAWIKAERKHPILAAHREGRQRHLEWIDLGGYSEPDSGTGWLQGITITKAQQALKRSARQDVHERAVVKQALRKLVNIHRTRLALKQGKLSFFKLRPVVEFTREQMLIHPKSVWGVAIYEVVKPHKGPLAQGLEFVKDLFNFAMMALAAIPNPLAPLAVMYDVARGAFTSLDEYVKYDLQKSFANTDLDLARSISDEEPSLTGFVVSLLGTGLAVVDARAIFKAAAAARRAMLAGDDAARRTLNDLGQRYDAGALGDDLARDAGLPTGGGAKPPATGAPASKPPQPAPSKRPESTGSKAPEPTASKPPESTASKPPARPPDHPSLTADELAQVKRYSSPDEVKKGVRAGIDDMKLTHGTSPPNPEMEKLEKIIGSMHDGPDKQRLLAIYKERYATLRDPDAYAEFAAYIWEYAARKKPPISTLEALEEIVTGGATPNLVRGDLTRDDLLKNEPFIDMAFNGGDHGTHTHMFQEGLLAFKHGPGAGKELRQLIAKAEGKAVPRRPGKPDKQFYESFWDAMLDEYVDSHINRPEKLQLLLEKYLGFPRRIPPR
jgi:hypothetical protein